MNDEEKKAIKIVNSLKEWGKIHFFVKDRSYARLTYNEVYLLLNLIEKQEKVIDRMAKKLSQVPMYLFKSKENPYSSDNIELIAMTVDEIKDYFMGE